MRSIIFCIALWHLILPPLVCSAEDSAITEMDLVRRTQQLLDALVRGDRVPWENYYAPDCISHDEKGRSLDKTKLVADIATLPQGYSASIKLAVPQSFITKDTAILSYDAIEAEVIFGQQLQARYHSTDTWLRRGGQWQIVAAQTMRYYEDPTAGRVNPSNFPAYKGSYKLSKESERTTTIFFEGEHLFMERPPGSKVELLPETADLFFREGVEGRILFRRGEEGEVDALIDRRNNEDVLWAKVR